MLIDHLISDIDRQPDHYMHGRVTSVLGMMAEIGGVQRALSIGDRVTITARGNRHVPAEVVGFRAERALVMPYGTLEGVGLGCRAEIAQTQPVVSSGATRSPPKEPNDNGATAIPPSTLGACEAIVVTRPAQSTPKTVVPPRVVAVTRRR